MMKLHPSIHLDAAQARHRERAAQRIETMRDTLTTLETFIAAADAETLRGDLWTSRLEDAELELQRAARVVTCDGQARMGYGHGKG